MTRREFIGSGIGAMSIAAIGSPKRGRLGSRNVYDIWSQLPYDSEVEYLGSTGTQYIDTCYVGSSVSTQFSIEYRIEDLVTNKTVLGSRVNPSSRHCWVSFIPEGVQVGYGGAYYNVPLKIGIGSRIRVIGSIVNGRFQYVCENLLSGEINTWSSALMSFPCTNKYVFWNGVLSPKSMRLYSLRFWEFESSELAADYIPVRITNEYGETEGVLYDRVSGMFFHNIGTGSFIIGPDV